MIARRFGDEEAEALPPFLPQARIDDANAIAAAAKGAAAAQVAEALAARDAHDAERDAAAARALEALETRTSGELAKLRHEASVAENRMLAALAKQVRRAAERERKAPRAGCRSTRSFRTRARARLS